MTWVKICGIQDIDGAQAAAEAGADAIGLMFAESSRKVSPEQAQKIAKNIGKSILKIGVFVNESPQIINHLSNLCHLDMVQLHGEEPPEYLAQIDAPIIKAFRIADAADLDALSAYTAYAFLLDSKILGSRGGTGHAFDWRLLETIKQKEKIVLAGGLHAENVAAAIAASQVFGVDVSSGVETAGQKDTTKIRMFIENAKQSTVKILT